MKHFSRIAIIVASLALLPDCSGNAARFWQGVGTVSSATVPGYTVVAAAQAFDGSELLAAAYLDLQRCSATSGPVCRVPSATPVIKGAFRSGRLARNKLKALVRQACAAEFAAGQPCNAGIPVASYNTLVAATKTIDDATAAYRAATGK